jgi:hypothetical protein
MITSQNYHKVGGGHAPRGCTRDEGSFLGEGIVLSSRSSHQGRDQATFKDSLSRDRIYRGHYTRLMLHFIQEFPSARLVEAAKPKAIAKALNNKTISKPNQHYLL